MAKLVYKEYSLLKFGVVSGLCSYSPSEHTIPSVLNQYYHWTVLHTCVAANCWYGPVNTIQDLRPSTKHFTTRKRLLFCLTGWLFLTASASSRMIRDLGRRKHNRPPGRESEALPKSSESLFPIPSHHATLDFHATFWPSVILPKASISTQCPN